MKTRSVLTACLLAAVLAGPVFGADSLASLKALARRYQVTIEVEHPPRASWEAVRYEPLSAAERESQRFQRYRGLFEQEFGKYPPGLVKLADVRQIALVKDLGYAGQQRAALPDFVKEILYLDVFRGEKVELYQRHVVHHEFYHLLEEEVYNNVYYKDPDWAALNPTGFSYGSGGANAQTGPQYDLVHPKPGFINRYAMSGLEEDKAEIFAALMVPQETRLIESWSRQDPYLRRKIETMKAFLKARVPEIDAAWWSRLKTR